ncbi:MAG TPA: Uma2 family endonuclease [Gemmataceae bacterium]|nr:Uma2 family endonuclease [Gemmataceae bacterium]
MGRSPFPKGFTVADFLKHLGDMPPHRVRINPPPGEATERDVLKILDHENRLFELVDGTLVEKPTGVLESCLAGEINRWLGNYVEEHDLGILTVPDGTLRLMPGLVRMPDVAFISWKQLPNRKLPNEPIASLIPELAVEVLSESNRRGEMERKLREYFFTGTQLVWIVDPVQRIVDVHTAPDRFTRLKEGHVLDGGDLLLGFELPLERLFARVERTQTRRRRTRRRRGDQ